jgi:hypothetical protein
LDTHAAADARRILLVEAFEAERPAGPLWTDDDAAWATRAAVADTDAAAPLAAVRARRARLALRRLAPRSAFAAAAEQGRGGFGRGVGALPVACFVAGVAIEFAGGGARIDLLAWPLWGIVAWNLVVLVLLAGAALRPGPAASGAPGAAGTAGTAGAVRKWLARRLAGRVAAGATPHERAVAARYVEAWSAATRPWAAARAAALLHGAAAALALGFVAGLYARGLVLDIRAGWQSTFLDAGAVQAFLAVVLAPASALTGIGVPDAAAIAALRVVPGGSGASGAAAPWLHLQAATLLLFAIGPRLVLAAVAGARAAWHARAVPVPAAPPAFVAAVRRARRQRRPGEAGAASVLVQPHARALPDAARSLVQHALDTALGGPVAIEVRPVLGHGEEAMPPASSTGPGAASAAPPVLAVLAVDLGATPEAEAHGRALAALPAGVPRLVLADEAAFVARFASMPARVVERRAAWRAFAAGTGAAFASAPLDTADAAALAATIDAALDSGADPALPAAERSP